MAIRIARDESRGARLRHPGRASFLLLVTALFGCGGDSTGTPPVTSNTISGRVRILNGPSVPTITSTTRLQQSVSAVVPANGRYTLSPDQARVSVLSLTFIEAGGGSQSAPFTNCNPTYARASASLSPLLDCPFEVRAGTYVGIRVMLSSAFSVLVDDIEGGFFSDPAAPTRLAVARPAAGPQFITFTLQGETIGSQVLFARPLVVDSAAARNGLTISVVIDMVHTIFVNVENGIATIDTRLPIPPVNVVPFAGAPGRAEVYSATGTARTARLGGPTSTDESSVHLYYEASGQPIYLFSINDSLPQSAWNANPATSALNFGAERAGGYLGLDTSGTLCWAVPTDYSYRQYAQLRSMRAVTTVGSTTTLSIQRTSAIASPTAGDTYATGCPAIASAQTKTLTLVAR